MQLGVQLPDCQIKLKVKKKHSIACKKKKKTKDSRKGKLNILGGIYELPARAVLEKTPRQIKQWAKCRTAVCK